MRSRHASMSFIISVEAKNIPKVHTHHSIKAQNNSLFFVHLHNKMRITLKLGYYFQIQDIIQHKL